MAAEGNAGVTIIKKVKKGGHDAHHGGAWKVAYADFVTAMMAFFLLLWLLNATTDEQKQGIADYFSPASISKSTSGGGGVLAGQTISEEGVMQANRSSVNLTISLPSADTPEEIRDQEVGEAPDQPAEPTRQPPTEETAEGETVEELLAKREEEQFKAAEEALRQAIQAVPELRDLAQHLIIDQTPEGLRIQLVDQEKLSMFPSGSADMLEHTRKLMKLVVGAISQLPNRIAIKGHTDAVPFNRSDGYSNWELSTDRANASRRGLIDAGLPAERIASVAGRAAEEPLLPDDPTSPRNRRISIILLREDHAVEAAEQAANGEPKETKETAGQSLPGLDVLVEEPASD